MEFCWASFQESVGSFSDVLASCYGDVSWMMKLNVSDWGAFSNESSVFKTSYVKDRIRSDGPSRFKQRKENRPERLRQNLIRVDH